MTNQGKKGDRAKHIRHKESKMGTVLDLARVTCFNERNNASWVSETLFAFIFVF